MSEFTMLLMFIGTVLFVRYFTAHLRSLELSPPYANLKKLSECETRATKRFYRLLIAGSIVFYVLYETFVLSVSSLGVIFMGA